MLLKAGVEETHYFLFEMCRYLGFYGSKMDSDQFQIHKISNRPYAASIKLLILMSELDSLDPIMFIQSTVEEQLDKVISFSYELADC